MSQNSAFLVQALCRAEPWEFKFPCKSPSEGINGCTAKRTCEGHPQAPWRAFFPQPPVQSFVPGAGLGPREAGDVSTKAQQQQQQQPGCKVTCAAKGCRSAARQRLLRAQEHGMSVPRVCSGGQDPFQEKKEKLGFSCRGFVTLLPKANRAFYWDNFKPTKELVLPRITLNLCHLLPCSEMLFHPHQWLEFCSAFHTSSSDRLKTSCCDIIQNLGSNFVSNPNHAVRPKPEVLLPTIFLLGTTDNINNFRKLLNSY